jgi:hypothetical protein
VVLWCEFARGSVVVRDVLGESALKTGRQLLENGVEIGRLKAH